MYESLLVSIVREMGGPVAIINLVGAAGVGGAARLLVAALLGMALSECRPAADRSGSGDQAGRRVAGGHAVAGDEADAALWESGSGDGRWRTT